MAVYCTDEIVDAPEHYEYARAMGLLTWGTWDTEQRSFEERLNDFLQAYPPDTLLRFQASMLAKLPSGEYGPASEDQHRARILAKDSSFGTLEEAFARYGLKQRLGSNYRSRQIETSPLREVTRLRNDRLRSLHGRVDVEAGNMDDAKAAEIERLERRRTAEQIREARRRMREDL